MIRTTFLLALLSAIALSSCREMTKKKADKVTDQFVFSTEKLKRYTFPTHINDLVIDRAKSSMSEVFMVIVEPGKTVMHHKHDDTEQIFYILEGMGTLLIGQEKKEYKLKVGDVVRIPVSTWHSARTDTNMPLKYLCVDCFGGSTMEPTWDEHVKVVCKSHNWDYEKVVNAQY